MDRGGNLIIPSFAVGRTQTLLYYFYRLHCEGRLDPDIPIIIDSPLAINATRVFLKNFRDFDEESLKVFGKNGKVPDFPQVHLCETAAESRAPWIIAHISSVSAASLRALRSSILSNSASAMERMSEFIIRMRTAIAMAGSADIPTRKSVRSLEREIFTSRPPLRLS